VGRTPSSTADALVGLNPITKICKKSFPHLQSLAEKKFASSALPRFRLMRESAFQTPTLLKTVFVAGF